MLFIYYPGIFPSLANVKHQKWLKYSVWGDRCAFKRIPSKMPGRSPCSRERCESFRQPGNIFSSAAQISWAFPVNPTAYCLSLAIQSSAPWMGRPVTLHPTSDAQSHLQSLNTSCVILLQLKLAYSSIQLVLPSGWLRLHNGLLQMGRRYLRQVDRDFP